MSKTIPYNKNLKNIKPYEPGKSKSKNKSKLPLIKLSSNETCLDFSDATKKKINKINVKLSVYPDSQANTLRDKISKLHKIGKKNIIFGNGSDEIFFLICNAFLSKGLEGLYSKYGFLIYPSLKPGWLLGAIPKTGSMPHYIRLFSVAHQLRKTAEATDWSL